jgi:hypothetical protein
LAHKATANRIVTLSMGLLSVFDLRCDRYS